MESRLQTNTTQSDPLTLEDIQTGSRKMINVVFKIQDSQRYWCKFHWVVQLQAAAHKLVRQRQQRSTNSQEKKLNLTIS